ncbi:MAG TPA: hypothetical protein VGG75_15960 [Trebonia sp.]|jgi:hypothetical protein
MLPLYPHRSGYATPLNSPKPPSAPVVKAAPKPPRPVAEIPVCTDDNPDTVTPLPDGARPEDVAAASARFRRAADVAGERARGDLAEAQRLLAEAQAEANRILAEAKSAAQQLQNTARHAAGEAEELTNHARSLAFAANRALEGAEAAAVVAKLEAQRDELLGRAAELERRSRELAAEQGEQDKVLAAARESGDLDKMTSVKARMAAISDLSATIGGQLDAVNRRLAEIGDGTEKYDPQRPHDPLPPLAQGRQTAEHGRAEAWRIADGIWPDSPGAVERERRETARKAAVALAELSGMGSEANRYFAARYGA